MAGPGNPADVDRAAERHSRSTAAGAGHPTETRTDPVPPANGAEQPR